MGVDTLRKIKESRGYKSYRMAKMLDISQTSYNYLEREAKGVQFSMLCRIRKAFGLSWQSLGKMLDEEFLDQTKGKEK
jgi:transcriptional regulator with XRE-family HTH domain